MDWEKNIDTHFKQSNYLEPIRDEAKSGEMSAAEEDLETRAAALGLNERTQRDWKETALPPTPSLPTLTPADDVIRAQALPAPGAARDRRPSSVVQYV